MERDLIRELGRRLANTEWLSPDLLRTHQAPLLCRLLAHARNTTAFYQGGLGFDVRSPDGVSKHWAEIPILTRAQAVANRNKLRSRAIPADAGPTSKVETSGSTGTPFAYEQSGCASIAATALTERLLRWWAVDGSKSYAQIVLDKKNQAPAPRGRMLVGWHSAHPNGIRYMLSVAADVDTQLDWLVARRPHYLMTYAIVMKELATRARERGIELKFALLLSAAMAVGNETRELCRSVFGAEIADTYGSTEADHIAAQCRDCGEYHVSAETSVVEVLRDDGSPAQPGESGRVIVTPLYAYAMPLIRYEIGDFAEVGTIPASCGRGLPTLRRILGRYRNMFRFRDGSVVFPETGNYRLQDFIDLKQFQLVQTDFDRVEIHYVPKFSEHEVDATKFAALTERIRTSLRQPVEILLRPVEKIERSAGGKYEDCVSLVART
jgi:phenylacetate-CoA ligase